MSLEESLPRNKMARSKIMMNFPQKITRSACVFLLAISSLNAGNRQETRGWRQTEAWPVATVQQLKLKVEVEAKSSSVTASDYCLFLNAAVTTDPYGLYEEKMGDDRLEVRGSRLEEMHKNKTACGLIARSGSPGSYSYTVASGAEEKAITYIDQKLAMCYCDWLENASSTSIDSLAPARLTLSGLPDGSLSHVLRAIGIDNFNSCQGAFSDLAAPDAALQSNRIIFCNVKKSDDLVAKSSGRGATGETMLGAVIVVASVLGAAEERPLVVEDFKKALNDHPTATHFVIREESGRSSIVAGEAAGSGSLHRSQNREITRALRAALEREHSRELVLQLLPRSTSLIDPGVPLTRERLQEIFQQLTSQQDRDIELVPLTRAFQEEQMRVATFLEEEGARAIAESEEASFRAKIIAEREEAPKLAQRYSIPLDVLNKCIEGRVQERALRKANKIEEADYWKEAIDEAEKAIGQHRRAIWRPRGNWLNNGNLRSSAQALVKSAQALALRAEWKVKEKEARKVGRVEEANLWVGAMNRAVDVVNEYRNAARDHERLGRYLQGNGGTANDYTADWVEPGKDKEASADHIFENAKSIASRAVWLSERGPQVDAARQKKEETSMRMAEAAARRGTEIQLQESAARTSPNISLADAYREIAALYLKSSQQFQQAAEIRAFEKAVFGREDKGISCFNAGYSLQREADILLKALEVEAAGQTSAEQTVLVEKYRTASKIFLEAATASQRAATAQTFGKEKEGSSYHNAGLALYRRAETVIKASEAEATALSARYNEAEYKYRMAAINYTDAARAWSSRWIYAEARDKEAKALYDEAEAMIKRIEEK